jgi:hypothetical protein
MNKQLKYLNTHWKWTVNNYGTGEGGWKQKPTAAKMVEQLLKHGYEGNELFILGRISDDEGWEEAQDGITYSHYCITDSSGEYILQPGEDDGDRTEEGVLRMEPPKGWVWVFVA